MTIGDRIRDARNNRGYSLTDCAIKAGVSKQTLYKYEHNIVTNIPSDKIEIIANILHVSPAYIMGWDDILSLRHKKTAENSQKRLDSAFFSFHRSSPSSTV